MRNLPVRRTAALAATLVMLLPGAAAGGSVSSGGPWTYSNQYTTCQFSGDHGSQSNHAFARTTNYNGGCKALAARLKSNPGPFDSGWVESGLTYPGAIQVVDSLAGSTAVSSRHMGMESWWNSWSPVKEPHAW